MSLLRSCLALAALLAAPPFTVGEEPSPTATETPRPARTPHVLAAAIVPMIDLDTPEGLALVDTTAAVDYAPLRANWVPQLKSHCGAASAVVVQNALQPGAGYTQDGLFTPETAHIITQDVVYRIGFTLEELTTMINARSGLKTARFHAGPGEGEHSYEDWIAALKKNRQSDRDHLIVNYAVNWLYTRENTGGHFSPIADYRESDNRVLVLEINPSRPSFWVDARELYDAMCLVDRISGRVRGWIVVESSVPAP